ncbi:MAG: aminodeoxychorismate synthase component I [Spongiibacteraceae bacterium]|jgi:para-aminobenzoate synthetase component 1|nr:aminodeoxychorismate synthase component I [Spongiibacteraceae bacterium]
MPSGGPAVPDIAVLIEPLPHHEDASQWLPRIRGLGNSVWLDSGRPTGDRGRFDIISAAPLAIVEPKPGVTLSAFKRVRKALEQYLPAVTGQPDIPFCGGAIGLLGYDTPADDTAPPVPQQPDFPCYRFGLYSWAIICDHEQQRTVAVFHPATPAGLQREVLARLTGVAPSGEEPDFHLTSPWQVTPETDGYRVAFRQVQEYIHAGDCYQINLARRWQTTFEGDPWHAYQRLRHRAGAPFSAWLETPAGVVMSLSPERFITAEGDQLWTQPIKGTAPRSADPAEDRRLAEELLASEKNRAENVMIVDLLRNDFGRSCEIGSIHVDRLFELQQFATVHHLVSSVRGRLRPEVHPLDALAASFPGGSITGAPKIRAMEIIAELEPFERSVFCGSIGYISACGRMDTNIAIRTLLACRGELFAWAGGAVVADSECQSELQETCNKIEPLLAVLS